MRTINFFLSRTSYVGHNWTKVENVDAMHHSFARIQTQPDAVSHKLWPEPKPKCPTMHCNKRKSDFHVNFERSSIKTTFESKWIVEIASLCSTKRIAQRIRTFFHLEDSFDSSKILKFISNNGVEMEWILGRRCDCKIKGFHLKGFLV